jgi:hypothetical protein
MWGTVAASKFVNGFEKERQARGFVKIYLWVLMALKVVQHVWSRYGNHLRLRPVFKSDDIRLILTTNNFNRKPVIP